MHVRARSEYSVSDGIVRVGDYVQACARLGFTHASITDLNSLRGIPELFSQCKQAGLVPIPGVDLLVSPLDLSLPAPYRVTLIAKDNDGYQGLITLLAATHRRQRRTSAGLLITPEHLLREHYTGGWFVLSGGVDGVSVDELTRGETHQALLRITRFKLMFGDDFFLEVCRTGRSKEGQINDLLQDIGKTLSVPLVGSMDVRLTPDGDLSVLHARAMYSSKGQAQCDLADGQRLAAPHVLTSTFRDLPECLHSIDTIARGVSVSSLSKASRMSFSPIPRMVPDGVDEFDMLADIAMRGLRECTADLVSASGSEPSELAERLDRELSLIRRYGLERLFLFIHGVSSWAFSHGHGRILVGGGAGSLLTACGIGAALPSQAVVGVDLQQLFASVLADKDSLRFVVGKGSEASIGDHIRSHYGRSRVAAISDVWRYGARSALRVAGTASGMASALIDRIAETIDENVPLSMQLQNAASGVRSLIEQKNDIDELLSLAVSFDGMVGGERVQPGHLVMAPADIKTLGLSYLEDAAGRPVIEAAQQDDGMTGLLSIKVSPSVPLAVLNRSRSSTAQDGMLAESQPVHESAVNRCVGDPDFWRAFCLSPRHDLSFDSGHGVAKLAAEISISGMSHLDKAIARRERRLDYSHIYLAAILTDVSRLFIEDPASVTASLAEIYPAGVEFLPGWLVDEMLKEDDPPAQYSLGY
ncbi:PHP domain-containing protein [Alcanivorax sp. 1008]|uniref:PHP domain-containing protein n=1 Tax=Alcanivorax sp. 1008 TaxID=2816853 RepID=UPI001D24D7F1|nr:PHP domain-containing protein [Alcanivorax sp. 1008]MCC1496785.1 PHP domain-containing protein [Alcanivorax sp. 1008]